MDIYLCSKFDCGQAISGKLFSAVISNDCNNILVHFGRRVVIRQTPGFQLTLECQHHLRHRATSDSQPDDNHAQVIDAPDDNNAQVLAAILKDKANKKAQKSKNKNKNNNKNPTKNNQPKEKQERKHMSKQIGCGYKLKFVCTLTDPCSPSSDRVWRLSQVENAKAAVIASPKTDDAGGNNSDAKEDLNTSVFCGHSCNPDLTLQLGGVLYLSQFTEPMFAYLRELLAVKSHPCELRLDLQEKFNKNFVDFGLIQTALEKIEPTHNHECSPEIAELLVYLEANKDSLLHRCRYWPTKFNGQQVREIRSVFFATKQMIRMFKEYGQLLVVDATYNLTNFTLKLLIFTIRTGTGSYNIAAVALIAEESEDDIQ